MFCCVAFFCVSRCQRVCLGQLYDIMSVLVSSKSTVATLLWVPPCIVGVLVRGLQAGSQFPWCRDLVNISEVSDLPRG